MDSHMLDLILTTVVLSFWVIFPIGMFLSVAYLEKNSDQLIDSVAKETPRKKPLVSQRPALIPH